MPRDGSNIYHIPPGTQGVPDATIESAKYNAYIADVEQDLNLPRPIIAGGTGASSADGALDSLSAEKMKQIVTNWDTMVWRAGSFFALANAIGTAPGGLNTHAFAGIVYFANATDLVLKATDLFDPANPVEYTRVMAATVWSPWFKTTVTGAVRYDTAQALTSAQQVQARQNIYAAPFDALAYNGMQINGTFDVNQERGLANALTVSGYLSDMWWQDKIGTMVPATNIATPFVGGQFVNWLNMPTATAQPALGANDRLSVYHSAIEGYRLARLAWGTANAQPLTIGFWTCHHRTGLYSGFVRNPVGPRSYVFSYTQNVADIAEYKVVTIPGDTVGTWNTGNGVGAQIGFTVAAGVSNIAPAFNVWNAVTYWAGPGQVNAVASTLDTSRFTGFIVLPGIEAPNAERSPHIMRPFDQELLLCQRYWEKSYDYAVLPGAAAQNNGSVACDIRMTSATFSSGVLPVVFKTRKRTAPTIIIYSPVTGAAGFFRDGSASADLAATSQWIGAAHATMASGTLSPLSNILLLFTHWTADARL